MFEIFKRNKSTVAGTILEEKDDDNSLEFLFSDSDPTRKSTQRSGNKVAGGRVTKARKAYAPQIESKKAILAYLKDRNGKKTKYSQIAKAIGATEGYTSSLVAELIANKQVTRRGKRGNFTFVANRTRVNKKRGVTKVMQKPTVAPQPDTPILEVQKRRGKTPEAKEKVYDFIARHEDRFISQADIARGSGTAVSRVGNHIKQLVEEGRIVRSLPTYEGTRYWLAENGIPTPETDEPKEVPSRLSAKSDDGHLLSVMDSLIWEFVRETRTTDVLFFLTWLENRNKSKE